MTKISSCVSLALTVLLLGTSSSSDAQSLGQILRKTVQDASRSRQADRPRLGTVGRGMNTSLDGYMVPPKPTPEEERLAATPIEFHYSEAEFERIKSLLEARKALARRFEYLCKKSRPNSWDCPSDLGGHVAGFYNRVPMAIHESLPEIPVSYQGLKALRDIEYSFEDWARYNSGDPGQHNRLNMLQIAIKEVVEPRRSQIESSLQPQILADLSSGRTGLIFDLFGNDQARQRYYKERMAYRSEQARAPSQTTNEGKIQAAALQSLYTAPGFTLARGFSAAEKRPGSVRVGAMGTYYDYSVNVRNATCKPTKTTTSCSYEMKLGLVFAIVGFHIPSVDSQWFTRRDVFQTRGGAFSSSSLDGVMHKIAASQASARSSSSSSSNPTRSGMSDSEMRQAFQDIDDGLYSTGRVVY